MIEPLPFRLRPPKEKILRFTGAHAIQSRVDGLLHLEEGVLVIEWAETRKVKSFAFERIGTDVTRYESQTLELPAEWLAEVRTRIWFRGPELFLRARRLDAFDDIPGSAPGILVLTVPFRHRGLIGPMIDGIAQARAAAEATGQLPRRRALPAEGEGTPV